ncbi:alpha/beta hydrolase [Nonomuraea sp. NPDC048916]|uniref:alpha/beta fold hydrolase n=1 Tax=Nonomuraea sp. NPDC048916 TaxID=3154232 RepID=UPI0033D1B211
MRTTGGYAETEWGQVHYRRNGDSGPWIGLFHESPLSSRVYEDVLPLLGRHARAIAFDTPGYGASDPPPSRHTEIPDYARVLAQAASRIGMERPVLGGVHTGASLAIETAAALPGGAGGLVLSGVPLFNVAERASYLSQWTPEVPFDDQGTQFRWGVERYRRIWGADVPPEMLHLAVVELMRTRDRYDWAYQAAFRHDPAASLAAGRAPVLLLDAEFDLLADKDALALELARDARLVSLAGLPGQPHLRAPDRYAAEILTFVREITSEEREPRP